MTMTRQDRWIEGGWDAEPLASRIRMARAQRLAAMGPDDRAPLGAGSLSIDAALRRSDQHVADALAAREALRRRPMRIDPATGELLDGDEITELDERYAQDAQDVLDEMDPD